MGSIRSVVATAAVAALLTSSCGDGDDPSSEPTPIMPSPSPSETSPSPSESQAVDEDPPEMPDAAKERSFEGVEEFMGYWAETLTYALNTGDTSSYDEMSDEMCESCNGTREIIDDIYSGGGSIRSGGWSVKQIGFSGNELVAEPVVRFKRGREVTRRPGQDVKNFPAARTTLAFELRRDADSWVVAEFEALG